MKIKKLKLRENYFFLSIICLVFAFGALGFIKTETAKSETENRTLAKFEHFTLKKFLDGSFQDNFENALSDQFPKSETICMIYGQAMGNLPVFGLDSVMCKNNYILVAETAGNKYGTFNCDDYILLMPDDSDDSKFATVMKNIDRLNVLNKTLDTYYYFINSSSNFDFKNNRKVYDYESLLAEKLVGEKGFSSFVYDNYDTYKKYFYKTDLHWNYLGSYRGFLDISGLLGISNPAIPTGVFSQGEDFYGSNAKKSQVFKNPDELIIYTFDIPEHETIIDGISGKSYNHVHQYIEHDYKTSNFDYYAYVYGINYGEIIFDFRQPTKENLLIIADSYSNPLNELIAQYYNKTYVIDGRYYEREIGEPFSLSDYLKKHEVDLALVIMSSGHSIGNKSMMRGLEL